MKRPTPMSLSTVLLEEMKLNKSVVKSGRFFDHTQVTAVKNFLATVRPKCTTDYAPTLTAILHAFDHVDKHMLRAISKVTNMTTTNAKEHFRLQALALHKAWQNATRNGRILEKKNLKKK